LLALSELPGAIAAASSRYASFKNGRALFAERRALRLCDQQA
jgi:hypothetical protein